MTLRTRSLAGCRGSRKGRPLLAVTIALALLAGAPGPQIKSYSLEEMVREADQAIHGQIVGARVFRVDSPVDGDELYFTTLTLQGRLLASGQWTTVDVTFHGGLVSDTEGSFNSEAPPAKDVRVGNHVVAFYRWSDNIGGGVAANALLAAHGGLYRTVETPRGLAVLGQGPGYAIARNRYVAELESAVKLLAAEKAVNPEEAPR